LRLLGDALEHVGVARLPGVAVGQADALQIERLEDRVQRLLGAHPFSIGEQDRLRVDVQPAGVEERAQMVEDVMALDLQRPFRDGAGIGVEVAQIGIVADVRLVLVVEHDLDRDLGIVRVDLGERQAGDVALERAAVGR
jgi:hypothetical protein